MVIVAAMSLSAISILQATAQQPTGKEISQLDMSAVPSLERDSVRIVQSSLRRKGFDPGGIDGVVGPNTRAAIRGFQDRYGMKASGEINNQLLFALGEVDLAIRTGGGEDRSR